MASAQRFGAIFLASAALVCAASSAAGAQPRNGRAAGARSVSARIEWAGSVCGDAEGFTARVAKRSRAVRFVESGEQVRVRLSIRPEGKALGARARLEGKGRPVLERHIESPDCDDALDALALVVAISLEAWPTTAPHAPARPKLPKPKPPAPKPLPPPAAPIVDPAAGPADPAPLEPQPSEPSPEPAPVEPAAPPVSPAPTTPAPAPEPPSPAPQAPAPVEPAVPVPTEPAPVASSPLESARGSFDWRVPEPGFHLQVAALGDVLWGAAPGALPGLGAGLRARWETREPFAPEVALAYAHYQRDGIRRPEGEAAFQLDAGTLELCPLAFGPPYLLLRPCLHGTLGELRARGSRTFAASRERRPWVSWGGGLHVVARWWRLELRATAALRQPLVRDSFRFASEACVELACPGDAFHRVDPLLWLGGVGVGFDLN